jgi:protein-tyrosine-phosphatase
MAEALLRRIDSRNFEAFSAGLTDGRAHPFSIEAMREIGIEMKERASAEPLPARGFDLVIMLDELSGRQDYSTTATETIHWKFENPLTISDNQQVQRRAFKSVRDQIAQRIRLMAIVHARGDRGRKLAVANLQQ